MPKLFLRKELQHYKKMKMQTRYQRYYEENREELRAKRLMYYKLHREKSCAKRREYYQVNKEKELRYCKEYNILNKAKRNAYSRNYHKLHKEEINERHSLFLKTPEGKLANKVKGHNYRTLVGGLTRETVQQVYEENIKKFGTLTCELCTKPCEFGWDSLEHFHPVSRKVEYGGDINERKNLGVAHRTCNSKKGTQTLEEFKRGERNASYVNVS